MQTLDTSATEIYPYILFIMHLKFTHLFLLELKHNCQIKKN